jgi:HEAT repeat protein
VLGRLGRPSSVSALAEALTAGHITVRSAAGLALASHSAPEAFDVLAAAAREGAPDAATAALDGLATREGDPRVCSAITVALRREDEAIVHHASAAARARGC